MNNQSFDRELLEFSSVMNSGYSFIVNNAGKVIALLTIIVTVLVTFTDVSFRAFGSDSFTTALIVMLISSYIIYFSLEESGEALGKDSEEYKKSLASYREAMSAVKPESVSALRSFCSEYAREELEYRRSNYLMSKGLSPEEYDEYKRGASFKGRARLILKRADAMKLVRLTPATLLSGEHMSSASELASPERKKLATSLRILLPSTACMIFTISVMLTAKDELSASVIIDGILKLSALPIIGFRAYSAGYSYAKNEKALWLETRGRLLSTFVRQKNNT